MFAIKTAGVDQHGEARGIQAPSVRWSRHVHMTNAKSVTSRPAGLLGSTGGELNVGMGPRLDQVRSRDRPYLVATAAFGVTMMIRFVLL